MTARRSPFFPLPTATPAQAEGFAGPLLDLPSTTILTRAGETLASGNIRYANGHVLLSKAALCAWSGHDSHTLPRASHAWAPLWFPDGSMLAVHPHNAQDMRVAPFVLRQKRKVLWKHSCLRHVDTTHLHDAMEDPALPDGMGEAYKNALAAEIAAWMEAAHHAAPVDPSVHPCDQSGPYQPAWFAKTRWMEGIAPDLPHALLAGVAKRGRGIAPVLAGDLTLLGGHVEWDGRLRPARIVATSTSHARRHALTPFLKRVNAALQAGPETWPLRSQIAPDRGTCRHGGVTHGAQIAVLGQGTRAPSAHTMLMAEHILKGL